MKITELKSKDDKALLELLKEVEIKAGKLSFERQRKTLIKSADLSDAKRTVAQIKTILHERNK